jgi:hypothetical protein
MSREVTVLLLERKIMKIPARNFSTSRTLNGLVNTIATLRLNLVKIPSLDALPYEMFIHGMPYEASETYRTIRNDFEENKSLAAMETRQAFCRY